MDNNSKSQTPNSKFIKILLIEDNPGDAFLIEEMLKKADVRFELKCAERLSAGIEQVKADSFDIILLDLSLPDSQGLGTLRKLNEIGPEAPVIVLTGLADEGVGTQAVKAGAQDYLIKGQIEKNLLARSINYAIERKKAKVALLKSEAALKEAQRVAHIGSWDWDALTDTIMWSEEYYRIYNLDPKASTPNYLKHLKIYTPESAKRLDAAVRKTMQTGEPYELDLKIAEPTGPTRWICARGEARRNDGGLIVGLRGTAQDITERKKAEEKLRESEEKFKSIFSSAMDGILIADIENYKFLTGNNAVCQMLGYTVDEIGGLGVMDIHPEKDMPYVKGQFEKLVRREIVIDNDIPVRRKDGSIFYADITASPMTLEGKACLIGIFRDITERKKAEEALIKLTHKIGLILNSAGEGIYGLDLDGKVIFINPAGARMLGYEVEELLGRHSHTTWHHSHPDGSTFLIEECSLNGVLKEGLPIAAENAVFWKKDGKNFPVEYTSTPIFEAYKLVGAVVTFRDITNHVLEEQERKKLEDQLRHAQKMEAIGTLAGGIAHDFNNILNVILGYGTMVQDSLEVGSPAKEQMNEVLAAADRAGNLTRRLLLFSRKEVAEVKPMDVNEMVMNMEKMLSRIIGEDIRLVTDLMGTKALVMADAGQIEQVLMNLATNARDAMPNGGSLTIRTELREIDNEFIKAYEYGVPGTYAVISITDTGTGIDKEKQGRIFDPFFTTKEVGKGTGLGLSIAYGIVKQHNGYIKVYSETGKGSTFKIWLPVIEVTAEKRQEVEALTSLKGGTETILVAEDDTALRRLTQTVLEALGYTVITAEDGEDAITKFMENREKIQLVMLDMIMPKKNGKEVSEVIRKESPRTKILFASGYTMDTIKTRELTESGFDFILKPVLPRDLLMKVREILDR